MYEDKLELDFLRAENLSLWEMQQLCDSLSIVYKKSTTELSTQLTVRDQQIENLNKMYLLEQEKYSYAKENINALTKQKKILITSTSAAVIIVVVLALL